MPKYHLHEFSLPSTDSLLKSLSQKEGIHIELLFVSTVCETFKTQESFVHLESPVIEKGGRNLVYKGIINCTSNERSLQISRDGILL